MAAWSPDSRAVIEVANSRWDSDSFAYYRIDGATATKLDLRALVEPVLTARLPPRNRQGNSFRVHEDLPVTLDARGTVRFTAMLYVPKGETSNDYKVQVNIRERGGKPSAQVVSVRRVEGGLRSEISLQIARFEMRALGGAETEAVAEIGFEVAIVGVDGLERGGKKRFLHRAQHLLDVVGQVAAGGGVPAVVAVGQEIIF